MAGSHESGESRGKSNRREDLVGVHDSGIESIRGGPVKLRSKGGALDQAFGGLTSNAQTMVSVEARWVRSKVAPMSP